MSLDVKPVTLRSELIRLEPLGQDHAQGLYHRGQSAADWAFMPRRCFVDLADTRHWVDEARATAGHLPFAIVENHKGRVVGSTRYLNIRQAHRGLEIGWTWLGRDWQRTGVNTEAKFLLLEHAFERLGCIRVEFKADARNTRSQAALERIGATREGVLRQHMVVQDDFRRDSVYFSILDREWPRVREGLEALRRRAGE
ncbi:GNAT family N-acetyltransferase [Parahaliea mediterranea]|uniref:GNAT family N-acetyltransferase n=1 Tax=Parahaliea mediterranea TaxID=651086 RepID=A0A939INU5_9GAMM|nr:GNAT family protein [Parahaliea mediterranea]MBN7798483.1 GNAT family N-acetyltransferase [Parahaliea mediterranea]